MQGKMDQTIKSIRINYDFSVGSLNVRGLNSDVKRNAVFKWAKDHKFDLLFLQECYCSNSDENKWKNEWDGNAIFSHGTNHSRGTAIFINKTFDYTLMEQRVDAEGRYVILKLKIQDNEFICVNIYAPNKMKEKDIFLET